LVWSTGQQLDAWIFLLFNIRGPRPKWLDWTMLGFTQLGNGFTTAAIAILIYIAGDRMLAYGLILGTLSLWLIVELIKAMVHRSRPFIHLTQTRIVGSRMGGLSFPSGHTSQAFFLASLLSQYLRADFREILLLYFIALLVGITRMYVGAHYPRDVLAGAIMGSAWGILAGIVNGLVLVRIG
jgi:membrane-associated phospholipid phosphatase